MSYEIASSSSGSSVTRWDDCVVAARDGDREALGQIFTRLRAYLRVSALEQLDRQLQVKVSPSDIVQETLLEAHRGFTTFHGTTRAELVVWVQGILKHRVQTAYRKYRGTTKRDLARETALPDHNDVGHQTALVTTSRSSPSGKAAANEELQRLDQALKDLPPRYEQVVRLRNELKLSFAEVGTALDCSADAAQKLWTRAIQQLTRTLQSDEPNRREHH